MLGQRSHRGVSLDAVGMPAFRTHSAPAPYEIQGSALTKKERGKLNHRDKYDRIDVTHFLQPFHNRDSQFSQQRL